MKWLDIKTSGLPRTGTIVAVMLKGGGGIPYLSMTLHEVADYGIDDNFDDRYIPRHSDGGIYKYAVIKLPEENQ